MSKADEKVEYEDGEKQTFTYFEELETKFEVLKEQFDEVVEILKENDLHRNKKVEAKYFDEDEVYKRLEQE